MFVAQFGGGISTEVALGGGRQGRDRRRGQPRHPATPSEGDVFKKFTDNILGKVHVVDYEGRHFLAQTKQKYDVIDLSLADSTGLSNPGGFAVVEKFPYTQQAMETYMRALAPGGVLSVTIWNKEEPPKSVLRLYTTMAAASRALDGDQMRNSFFVVSSYLSTATVLYKRGGFTEDEVAALRKHTHAMSFDEIYSPGFYYDGSQNDRVLNDYVAQFFSAPQNGPADRRRPPPTRPRPPTTGPRRGAARGGQGRRQRAALDPDGAHVVGRAGQGRRLRHRQALCLQHPEADQRPSLFHRLCEDQGSAGDLQPSRAAGAVAGRVGLSLDLGDARRRLPHRRRADGHPVDLRLALDLLEDAGQGAHGAVFRLPRRRLHHGRGRAHRPFRHGARQSRPSRPPSSSPACWCSPASARWSRSACCRSSSVFMPILFVVVAAMLAGYALYLDHALDAIGALPLRGAARLVLRASSRRRRS